MTITNASDPGARLPRSHVAIVPTEHSPCDGRADNSCAVAGGISMTRVSDRRPGPWLATITTNDQSRSVGAALPGPAMVTESPVG